MEGKAIPLIEGGREYMDSRLWYVTFTYTNTGSTAITQQEGIFWIAKQLKNYLDSLPDGWFFEPVAIQSYGATNNHIISTTGTNHSVKYGFSYTSVGANGNFVYSGIALDNETKANNHYSIGYISSSGASFANYDNDVWCPSGSTRAFKIYFRMILPTSADNLYFPNQPYTP